MKSFSVSWSVQIHKTPELRLHVKWDGDGDEEMKQTTRQLAKQILNYFYAWHFIALELSYRNCFVKSRAMQWNSCTILSSMAGWLVAVYCKSQQRSMIWQRNLLLLFQITYLVFFFSIVLSRKFSFTWIDFAKLYINMVWLECFSDIFFIANIHKCFVCHFWCLEQNEIKKKKKFYVWRRKNDRFNRSNGSPAKPLPDSNHFRHIKNCFSIFFYEFPKYIRRFDMIINFVHRNPLWMHYDIVIQFWIPVGYRVLKLVGVRATICRISHWSLHT